jgi:hypothetical protein
MSSMANMEVKKNVSLVGLGWVVVTGNFQLTINLLQLLWLMLGHVPDINWPCNWLSEMGPKIYVRSGCVDFPAATICQLYTKFC